MYICAYDIPQLFSLKNSITVYYEVNKQFKTNNMYNNVNKINSFTIK